MTSSLRSLAHIILNGVEAIKSVYAQNGTEFPSLDEPFQPGPLDGDAVLADATRLIVGAAVQLVATVRQPVESILDCAPGMYSTVAMGFAVDANIADVLRDAGPKGLHVENVGRQIGVEANKTARILRYLASRHVFKEILPNVFANNRISSMLTKVRSLDEIKKDPITKYDGSPVAAAVAHMWVVYIVRNRSWIMDPRGFNSAFNMAVNSQIPMFEWFEQPGNEWRATRFIMTMKGAAKRCPPKIFTDAIKSLELKPGSIVVDIGGNVGAVTLLMLQTCPDLLYIVQDLPTVISDAEKYWSRELPGAISQKQVTLQACNFLEPQPVKSAALYFMRNILHDWPTAECLKIMKIIRQAACPTSKLVVFEAIMPHACDERLNASLSADGMPSKPPFPLLANLGAGLGAWVTMLDLQMMTLFNGQERTIEEFAEIGASTGWKLESVRYGDMGTFLYSAA